MSLTDNSVVGRCDYNRTAIERLSNTVTVLQERVTFLEAVIKENNLKLPKKFNKEDWNPVAIKSPYTFLGDDNE